MLADVLQALRSAIADWNQHWVNGSRYGRWQPAEYFARQAPKHLRPVAAEDRWIFAPFVSAPLKVRKADLQTTVPLAEGFSEKFSFTADWLLNWLGASVRLHWNPFAADEFATATLAEPFNGQRSGTLIGRLEMTDRHARWTRRNWGYSEACDAGTAPALRSAQAVHRTSVAIRTDGKPGVAVAEARDGVGRVNRAESGETTTAAPADLGVRIPAARRAERRDLSEFDPGELLGEAPITLRHSQVEELDAAVLL